VTEMPIKAKTPMSVEVFIVNQSSPQQQRKEGFDKQIYELFSLNQHIIINAHNPAAALTMKYG